MKFEACTVVQSSAETIFATYAAVSQWPAWDPEVEWASLDGAFALGGTGKVKPKGVSETKIEITELTPNASLTTRCKLPLCTMDFVHVLKPQDAHSTLVINEVVFAGFLAPVFGRLIGKSIAKTMPATLAALKHHVEAK